MLVEPDVPTLLVSPHLFYDLQSTPESSEDDNQIDDDGMWMCRYVIIG